MVKHRARALAACLCATALATASCGILGRSAATPPRAASSCSELTATAALTPPPVDPRRPAMGFDPYNTFGTTIDQGMIAAIVRAMARNGMRAAGYRYIILDDGLVRHQAAGRVRPS
jgi:hypothetical protein